MELVRRVLLQAFISSTSSLSVVIVNVIISISPTIISTTSAVPITVAAIIIVIITTITTAASIFSTISFVVVNVPLVGFIAAVVIWVGSDSVLTEF
jgi:hypothetical protein